MKITEFWSIWIIALLTVFSTGAKAQGLTGAFARKAPMGVSVFGSRLRNNIDVGSISRSSLGKAGGIAAVKTVETVITEDGCPEGFTSFADSCFLEGVIPVSWKIAGGICKQAGGDLASVNSKEEYDFIRREFGNGHKEQMWIGLSKQTPGTPYTWANGERVRYLPWTLNYTGQEPTGYVALSLKSIQFFPKSNPKTPLPFLCGTKRVPDTASAAAAAGGADAGGADAGGAAAAVGGAAAVAGGAAAAAGGANIAEQHKAVDVRAADITQVGMARKTIGLHPPQCDEGWESFLDKCYKVIKELATHMNASHTCVLAEAELLSMHDPSECEFVRKYLLKDSPNELFWIGLANDENGKLEWTDGSPLDYSNLPPEMSVTAPERIAAPEKRDLRHLEKCFQISAKDSAWVSGDCFEEHCFVCSNNGASPVGAAEALTELQNSTTPLPTSPGSTRETSTSEVEWFFVNHGKPHEGNGAVAPKTIGKLPSYLLNGGPALGLFNVSGINLDPKTVVFKSDDSAESESEAEDNQKTLTIFFVVVGTIAAVVMAAIGVIKLRRFYGNSPSSWTSLRNSSRASVHSLDNVHQSLRDPETWDENQQADYGAME